MLPQEPSQSAGRIDIVVENVTNQRNRPKGRVGKELKLVELTPIVPVPIGTILELRIGGFRVKELIRRTIAHDVERNEG